MKKKKLAANKELKAIIKKNKKVRAIYKFISAKVPAQYRYWGPLNSKQDKK